MIRNYFKIAIRTIRKGDVHFFLNILGLGLGIAVILLIGGYVTNELNVNRDLKDVDRTYVIHSRWSPENLGVYYTTLGPLSEVLLDQFPLQVEGSYRYTLASSTVSSSTGKLFREQLQIGDNSLIAMFGFPLAHGNAKAAFAEDGIVVTETVARKYFGKTDVIGERLILQTNSGLKVPNQITAVLKDIPSNSVVNFANSPVHNQIFLPMSSLRHFMDGAEEDWSFKYMVSIIKLSEGIPPSDIEQNLNSLVSAHAPPEFATSLVCELKPLRDYYLQWGEGKMYKMVRVLSIIALFILLLVVSNFISIMISGSSHRLREIGLRKLFGGGRRQLIIQFLAESVFVSFVSMVLALVLYVVLRPPLQDLLSKPLTPLHDFKMTIFLGITFLSVVIGCLAGLYPAFRLSNFKIVSAVKGKLPAYGEGNLMRKSLLCFQVTIASFVLISSIFIARQFEFIQNFDLGFDQEGILVITSLPREWNENGVSKLEAIRTSLLNQKDIINASISYEVPDGNAGSRYNFRSTLDKNVDMPLLNVDENFARTYGLQMLAGTFFNDGSGAYQKNRVVVSERAVNEFGWTPEEAIGKRISSEAHETPLTIVGVVNNFHFYSLFESIQPISMVHIRDKLSYRYLSLRLKSEDPLSTIERLQPAWTELFPEAPFDYVFMDDKLKQYYAVEDRMHKSSKVATIIATFIMVCGIVAFMSVSMVRRVKEIGIRRVHGATPAGIIILFVKEFSWQYILGGIFSCALAYYFLTSWLAGFQYKITLSAVTFMVSYLAVVLVMVVLITVYSLRTVLMNPVKTLRYE
jgi:putative ABC transport system permease protein